MRPVTDHPHVRPVAAANRESNSRRRSSSSAVTVTRCRCRQSAASSHMVRTEDLPPVETMRDEAADCLRRHLVTVTAEEDARRREFDARLAAATRAVD